MNVMYYSTPGHYGQTKHCDRDTILDGSRGDPGDRIRLCSRHLEFR